MLLLFALRHLVYFATRFLVQLAVIMPSFSAPLKPISSFRSRGYRRSLPPSEELAMAAASAISKAWPCAIFHSMKVAT